MNAGVRSRGHQNRGPTLGLQLRAPLLALEPPLSRQGPDAHRPPARQCPPAPVRKPRRAARAHSRGGGGGLRQTRQPTPTHPGRQPSAPPGRRTSCCNKVSSTGVPCGGPRRTSLLGSLGLWSAWPGETPREPREAAPRGGSRWRHSGRETPQSRPTSAGRAWHGLRARRRRG